MTRTFVYTVDQHLYYGVPVGNRLALVPTTLEGQYHIPLPITFPGGSDVPAHSKS